MAGVGGPPIGRAAEIDRLVRSGLGVPAVIVVEGEAGVGKSRLVAEAAQHPAFADRTLLFGRCRRAGPFPLEPFVDALRRLSDLPADLPCVAGALAPLLPELAAFLPPPPLAASDHVRFRALAAVLDALGPALCILEDVQWADRETGRFLRFLAADPPGDLALIVTYRPEDLPASSPVAGLLHALPAGTARDHIRVGPLDESGVGQLLEALGGMPVEPSLAAAVRRRTGGIPFVIEQVVSAGVLEKGPAPDAVCDAVLARLISLHPMARRLVEAAAVAGEPAPPDALIRIAGLTPSVGAGAVANALAAGALVEHGDGAIGFAYTLAGDVVMGAIPGPERRRLAGRAAVVLPAHPNRAMQGGRQSARARARRAMPCPVPRPDTPAAAARRLSDALAKADLPAGHRMRLAASLGSMMLGTAGNEQRRAMTALARLLDSTDLATPVAGRVRWALGALQVWSGDARTGYHTVHRSLEELHDDPVATATAMADLAAGPQLELGIAERLDLLDRAEQLAASAAHQALDLHLASARARVLLHAGDRRAWMAMRQLPVSPASAGERRLMAATKVQLAWGCVYVGADRRARSLLADASALPDPLPYRLAMSARVLDLQLRFLAGDWAGLDSLNQPDDPGSRTAILLQIDGLRALAAGDLAHAVDSLNESAERAERGGQARSLAVATAGLARLDLLQGDPDAARQRASRAVECLTSGNTWVWAAEVVGAALESTVATGRLDEADALARAFAAGVRDLASPTAAAVVAANRGVMAEARGNLARAAGSYRRAAHAFARLPRPYDAARAAVAAGRCSLGAGLRTAATVDLTAALARFTAVGATHDAAAVSPLLEACSEDPGPQPSRRGRPPYGSRLSPREIQVVDLAAAGLTNTEIADELGLSPRTVEDHVAAGLRKLGLPSKRSLAGRLATPDLPWR